jgi:hypothetical protein
LSWLLQNRHDIFQGIHNRRTRSVQANFYVLGYKNSSRFSNKGAETPLYLALLPIDFKGPRGAFWAENQTLKWNGNILVQALKGIPPTLKKTLFKKSKKTVKQIKAD